ncbi:hypothetical protein [Pseudomonas inefficax]|uniref:hypothetical protein n=1 Tax=Pseudomonas inefficax TaxID=2078786 RepID=UPI004046B258
MEGEPLVEEVIPSLAEVQSSLRIALGSPSHRLWLSSRIAASEGRIANFNKRFSGFAGKP